jgi:hypothetical protein
LLQEKKTMTFVELIREVDKLSVNDRVQLQQYLADVTQPIILSPDEQQAELNALFGIWQDIDIADDFIEQIRQENEERLA